MSLSEIFRKTSRRLRNNWIPKTDWSGLLHRERNQWEGYRVSRSVKKKVLIATTSGGDEALTPVASLLAAALTVRGAEAHILLCDQFLPACQMQTLPDLLDRQGRLSEKARRMLCDRCQRKGHAMTNPFGLPIHWLSQWVDVSEKGRIRKAADSVPRDEIRTFVEDGLRLGEHAYAGALRFFAKGDLEGEQHGEEMLRRYFTAALLTKVAFERIFKDKGYDVVVFDHGIYIPQGVVGEVARRRGVRVVNWNLAYRRRRLIFSHGDTYHHTLMDEPTKAWQGLEWSPELDARLERYLQSRWTGAEDWISFQNGSKPDGCRLADLGLDAGKPTALLLTNVIWDAQLHYPGNAFSDMMKWVSETLDYFALRKDLQLVVRVHPAEIRGIPRSRQRVADEIRLRFPLLPPNIFLISPESSINTYAVARQCDAALIYATKTGVELAAQGIPIIVAGEAWIRNKGISFDASSRDEYLALLNRLPFGKRLETSVKDRARRYAFHFFFRRMIPVSSLVERRGLWPPIRTQVENLESLAPGRDSGLDVICGGILAGSDFIYPEEKYVRENCR